MANYKEELWKACKLALQRGGEVRIMFTKRGNNRIPIITIYLDNYTKCDEETIIQDD